MARDEPGLPPVELTGFVGRKAELTGLTALLDTARLVTAVGPPGVGKTRVGLRAAALAAERYPDGVRFAELSELRDPALLAAAIAACLGLPERDGRSQPSAVLNYLRGRELLLILDTCEHLIDACAAFAEGVLREAPRVTLLATSRQPLDVPGSTSTRCARFRSRSSPRRPTDSPRRGTRGEPTATTATRRSSSRSARPW